MKKEYSIEIIIPVYNESDNICNLICALQKSINTSFTILFVDDGSSDNTLEIIKKEALRQPGKIKYISFSRNFGHQIAIKAGFDYADADCIITMDGDLQHPPSLIPVMVDKWLHGADVVNTLRQDNGEINPAKSLTSLFFYKVYNFLSFVNIKSNTADFRLLDKKIVTLCRTLQEDNFFWRGLIPWLGFNQIYISYEPAKRKFGKSKYTLTKMISLAWQGISSFSLLPLRFAILVGSSILFLSSIYGFYILYQFISGNTIPGWSSLMLSIMGLGGLQIFILGIIGEYVGKIFFSTKKRPQYIIKEKFSNE